MHKAQRPLFDRMFKSSAMDTLASQMKSSICSAIDSLQSLEHIDGVHFVRTTMLDGIATCLLGSSMKQEFNEFFNSWHELLSGYFSYFMIGWAFGASVADYIALVIPSVWKSKRIASMLRNKIKYCLDMPESKQSGLLLLLKNEIKLKNTTHELVVDNIFTIV